MSFCLRETDLDFDLDFFTVFDLGGGSSKNKGVKILEENGKARIDVDGITGKDGGGLLSLGRIDINGSGWTRDVALAVGGGGGGLLSLGRIDINGSGWTRVVALAVGGGGGGGGSLFIGIIDIYGLGWIEERWGEGNNDWEGLFSGRTNCFSVFLHFLGGFLRLYFCLESIYKIE